MEGTRSGRLEDEERGARLDIEIDGRHVRDGAADVDMDTSTRSGENRKLGNDFSQETQSNTRIVAK